VSDEDRELALATLREHTVSGRLTLEEFSERVERALAARTRGELDATGEHLPQPAQEPGGRLRRFMVTIIGSEQRQGRWRVPARIWAVSIFGAPDLDLRQAVIGSSEVTITSISLVGKLTALVPAGVDVEVGGLALVGGNDLTDEGQARAAGGPTVRIRSYALLGGARVTLMRSSQELEPGSERARPP
jgi:Domain of unknown function (DUF1707)